MYFMMSFNWYHQLFWYFLCLIHLQFFASVSSFKVLGFKLNSRRISFHLNNICEYFSPELDDWTVIEVFNIQKLVSLITASLKKLYFSNLSVTGDLMLTSFPPVNLPFACFERPWKTTVNSASIKNKEVKRVIVSLPNLCTTNSCRCTTGPLAQTQRSAVLHYGKFINPRERRCCQCCIQVIVMWTNR